MKSYQFNQSNYDKSPVIRMPDLYASACFAGWEAIAEELHRKFSIGGSSAPVWVIECYQGVLNEEVAVKIQTIFPDALWIDAEQAMQTETELNAKLAEDITDDELFGYMTRREMKDYFDETKVAACRTLLRQENRRHRIVYGTGAAYLWPEADVLIYADMARWEIQMRFRKNLVNNIGVKNRMERASLQYKRGFFVDWRICDRWKKKLMSRWEYVLDSNCIGSPQLVTAEAIRVGLKLAVCQPFRVVPFFDPGPWGGQWMKKVCALEKETPNYAWCFDCVPEENSIYLAFGQVRVELPALDVVFAHPVDLLGEAVYGRFGDEFPIRFDLLDTMQGGNLSLQVHPLTAYIQEKFGMHYTQDESYYLLDAAEDAVVYVGLKENIQPDRMITALEEAQHSGSFDAHAYVGAYPVKKHDHILIPAGTVHCSGANGMVLEISATPFIFTFKLWDWGRMGLDGRPRPINIAHGKEVIQWERAETWVRKEILNRITPVGAGDGWREERTGLHEREFIETRRHWFTRPVLHHTDGSVNVLNLVEGREAIVESPTGSFAPFPVHYAETFIIPAAVGVYTIRPYGESEGKECATIKAFVRHHG